MRTVLMTGAVFATLLVGCGRHDAPTQRAAVEAQAPDRQADAPRRHATAQPRPDPCGGGMLEGVSRGGRAFPVRRPPARRREDGGVPFGVLY